MSANRSTRWGDQLLEPNSGTEKLRHSNEKDFSFRTKMCRMQRHRIFKGEAAYKART